MGPKNGEKVMQIGDLVSLYRCDESVGGWLDAEGNRQPGCSCGMCGSAPSKAGIVTEKWMDEDDSWSYICEFDVGQQVFRDSAPGHSHFSTQRLQVISL